LYAIEMRDISKYFASSDVLANDRVSFAVAQGEVHALVGENGAGKTTLMNILYGLVEPDQGEILVGGEAASIRHPDDAIHHGIGMVHQHFKLVPSFTVAENIMLGMEPNRAGWLRKVDEVEAVARLAAEFGLPVDPAARVRDLPVGMQQRVEILKALQRQAQVLVLDEPTAILTPQEAHDLFGVVRKLAASGRTVIFISHKLLEVMDVADRVTVMRKGQVVGTKPIGETSVPDLALMMVGREILLRVEKEAARPGEVVLEAEDLLVAGAGGVPAVRHISFQVRKGEVLGIAGVSGNGQTEMVEAITGMRPVEGGRVLLNGVDITHRQVGERRREGMAHIPEDRLVVGLNVGATIDENLIVSRYRRPAFSRLGLLRMDSIRQFARRVIDGYAIAAARPGGGIATLSGGNLQKVVLGRELSGDPDVIVANQPTRGLDVGSIEFVHQTLLEARARGAAILLVSVELEEILSLSDRVAVLFRGQVAGEMPVGDATEESLGLLMAGSSLDSNGPNARVAGADGE
jgi:simple sugar transport system ATP-binding protein